MDKTTLTLAVDSTQVNTAAAALSKMAGEGYKAETVAVRLGAAATQQGKALATAFGKGALDASAAVKGLTGATSSLAAGQDFSKTAASLSAAAAQAKTATAAVQAFGAAISAASAAKPAAAPNAPTQTKLADAVRQPVAVVDRSAGVTVTTQPVTDATNALGKMAAQAAKTQSATEALTEAAKAQGAALDASVAGGAEKATAALGDMGKASASTSYAVPGTGVVASVSAAVAKQVQTTNDQDTSGTAQLTTQASALGSAASKSVKGVDDLGKSAKAMAQAHQIAAIQVKDFVEQVIAGGSPVRAFAQQGLAVVSTYGGFKAALSGIASLLSPFRIGVGAVVAALGTFGYAQYQASQQSKAFKDALVLTGNFAGITEQQFDDMAKHISDATHSSMSSVREMITALANTGQIKLPELADAAEAAQRYAKATGKTPQDVAGELVQARRNPLGYVDEANKSGSNLFSAADRQTIKDLQESGKIPEAFDIVVKKWSTSLKGLESNVGTFGKALDEVKTKASQFIDFLGRLKIPDSILAGGAGFTGDAPIMPAESASMVASEVDAQRQAAEEKAKQDRARAEAESKAAEIRQKGTAAAERLDALNERANPAETAKRVKSQTERDIADAAASGKAYTPAQIARMRLQNALDTTDPRILQNASVNYSTRVQQFQDTLQKEQQALSFFNQYQQNQYQAGAVSLDKFYDDKVENIRKGTSAEIAELEKEKAATQQLLRSVVDPTQRAELQGRIKRFDTQKAMAADRGNYEEALARQEREAAQRGQADQVDNFRATLAQSSGDELGASLIRAQTAERQNRIFAGQSGGKITEADVQRQTALTIVQAKYQDVLQRSGYVAQSTARAEEAANLVAEQSGKSLLETENDIYAVRSKTVEQLGKLNAQMQQLAAVSTDPKIKQAAADIAVQFASAVDKMDPALQRLRAMQKDIASSITGSIDSGIANFGQNYVARRQQQQQDVLNGGKSESAFASVFKTIGTTVILPMAGQITASINKVLITDPLQKYIEGQMKALTEDGGPFAGFFKDVLGIKDKPVDAKLAAEQAQTTAMEALSTSVTSQTAAADAATTALQSLANAASSASGAMGGSTAPNSTPLQVETGSKVAYPSMGDFTRADRALSAGDTAGNSQDAQQNAGQAAKAFDANATAAAKDIAVLAQAANKGGASLGLLPTIVNLFSSAVSAMGLNTAASGGSGGGIFGAIAGLFGSGSGSVAAGMATNSAGMAAGQGVSADALANLMVYGLADGGLVTGPGSGTSDSIPAMLSNGEFVVPAQQTATFLPVLEAMRGGDSAHAVMKGLFDRLGVKGEQSGVAAALHVHGAREMGGPVSQGKLYRVNEKGPELLNVAGKQYLMMGAQGGNITPNNQLAGGGRQVPDIHIHQSFAPGTDRTTVNQAAAQSGNAARRALTRIS